MTPKRFPLAFRRAFSCLYVLFVCFYFSRWRIFVVFQAKASQIKSMRECKRVENGAKKNHQERRANFNRRM